jgi:hypothetical protein
VASRRAKPKRSPRPARAAEAERKRRLSVHATVPGLPRPGVAPPRELRGRYFSSATANDQR